VSAEEKEKAMEDWEKLKAAEKKSLEDYRTQLAMCNICAAGYAALFTRRLSGSL